MPTSQPEDRYEHDANAARPNPIGILAGMGVHSTAPFLELVIRECRNAGARREIDYPPMLIRTVPVPWDADGPIDHAVMRDTILSALVRLDRAGVRFVAIPCNTAHIYFHDLKASADAPVLNMIDEAVVSLDEAVRRPALLATRPTVEACIYQDRLLSSGRAAVWSEMLQGRVDDLLVQVKRGVHGAGLADAWNAVLAAARAEDADGAIIACTDINVAPIQDDDGRDRSFGVHDATRALARAVAARWAADRASSEADG